MLTILNDPAGATGRHRHAWDYSLTIQANVELHLSAGGDARVLLNGEQIDPATHSAMERLPTVADSLTVIRRPAGFDPFSWTALAIYAAVAAIAMVALMPRPNLDMASGKDSPNNKLTGQSNIARAYQGIPDVYGYRRVWPDLIQPSTIEYVGSQKMVTEWLCISRGRGTITAVQYADTPIGDIDGASYEVFEPTPGADGYPESGSTVLHDVIETFACPDVNGQELDYAVKVEAADQVVTLLEVTPERFRVTYSLALITDEDDIAAGQSVPIIVSTTTGTVLYSGAAPVTSAARSGPDNLTATVTFAVPLAAATGDSVRLQVNPGAAIIPTVVGPFSLPIECDRLRWNTVFLRGLKGGAVQIKSEWWRVDASGNEVSGTRESRTDAYDDTTYDARYFTQTVTPAGGLGRYRIQFARLNGQQHSSGADAAKLESVYALRSYATKVLPGVTVLRVTTRATEQATGFSDRKFNLRWARHVRALTGDTLSASRNFGRAMAHVWTLAGNDMAELDTDALAAINAELGEASPLLRFDQSLDDADMSLGERLQRIADHARCRVWRDGTRWTVTRDQRRDYPEMQLDYRVLAAGGESASSYSAQLPASHDGIELEYVDEATQAKKAYVRLNVSSGAVVMGASSNPKKISLPGCTTQAQAENRAHLEARKLLYVRQTVQDTLLAGAGVLGPGALVRWIDPADFDGGDDGLQAGEVLAVAGDTIATSEPLEWAGETMGRMLLTGADGLRLGPPVLCYPAAGGARLATAPAGLFVADGVTMQLGSRYAFAVGLTEAEIEAAGLFTVEKAEPQGDGKCSVLLSQYDARTYDYDDADE